MALDPFNSVGGYSIGIPPVPIIDAQGSITAPSALIGNVVIVGSAVIAGDTTITGNVSGSNFVGNFAGNLSGTVTVPGGTNDVLINNNGKIAASNNFTFNTYSNTATLQGQLYADKITLGTGANQFCTSSVSITTTSNNDVDQVLHSIAADSISSIDYTIVATDPIGNNRQTTKLYATILGTDMGYLEFSTIDVPITSPGVGDFKVANDIGLVKLTVSPLVNNNVTYKILITSYAE
jgi:hypothetical protein